MTKKLLLSELLTEEQCREWVTDADMADAASFSSTSRRQEYLTWRAMLYKHLGCKVEIAYEDSAPIVVGSDINIGVSHTTDMAAVVISPDPCAVDIERKDRDIARIAERFFTAGEQQLSVDNRSCVAIWCARECYYKYRRDRKLDILNGVRVTKLDFESGEVTAEDNSGLVLDMKIEQTAEHIVVYVL
ncbi:MAG: 4'-phosphopantetheinyl transferase superfamily protein [Alistipes sp.]|nr:4'-phosphopantetheinyl transferase superfamily protein [Alistipes sp.]